MSGLERSKIELVAESKWRELKAALRRGCESVGTLELRIIEESPEEFILERIKDRWVPKRLRLEFDAHISRVTWWCCDPTERTGEIYFRVLDESVLYVVGGKNRTLDEIVMVLMSCVTGKIV
jgi:hypothetical protein